MSNFTSQSLDVLERAVLTAAQAGAASAIVELTPAHSLLGVSWVAVGSVSGLAAVLSLLKSLIAIGASGTASAVGAVAPSAGYTLAQDASGDPGTTAVDSTPQSAGPAPSSALVSGADQSGVDSPTLIVQPTPDTTASPLVTGQSTDPSVVNS